MSNRHQRRAAQASEDFPELPALKNMSGTDQCCGNCPKRASEKAIKFNRHILRQPALAEDQVICLAVPGAGMSMPKVGWCALWGEPNVVKIAKE